MRRTLGAVALILGALIATPCAASSEPRSFIVAQTTEPSSLDPLLLTGLPAEEIGSLVYSYLLRIDERGRLVPDLATRVPSRANGDIAPDGRTITYHLRRDVRWHDGVRFTARDVIATYRAVMDARNAVPTRLGFDRITAIDAPDPWTVRLRLRAPFAPFLTYFFETENYPVLPAHIIARTPTLATSPLSSAPIGTGPYRVRSWKRSDTLRLVSYAHYHGGAPHIESITIRFVGSAQTIVELLATGEADASFGMDPAFIDRLRANARLHIVSVPIYGFEALSFQTRDPVLRDPRVRRAIAASFDLARDLQRTTHGALDTVDPGRALFTWAYRAQPRPTADPDRLPLHLTLAIDGSRTLERAIAIQLQDEARRNEWTIEIVPYAPQLFDAPIGQNGPLEAGHYQLALHAILTGADPETSWLIACDQVPPAGYNITRYCNRTVDRALADALATFDEARRARDYAIVQQAIARDLPFVMLWQTHEIEAIPAGLHGFAPSRETPWFAVERWSL